MQWDGATLLESRFYEPRGGSRGGRAHSPFALEDLWRVVDRRLVEVREVEPSVNERGADSSKQQQ